MLMPASHVASDDATLPRLAEDVHQFATKSAMAIAEERCWIRADAWRTSGARDEARRDASLSCRVTFAATSAVAGAHATPPAKQRAWLPSLIDAALTPCRLTWLNIA